MKLWIARNRSGSLLLFSHIPLNKYGHWLPLYDSTEVYVIDHKLFPEVTYENSPQTVDMIDDFRKAMEE